MANLNILNSGGGGGNDPNKLPPPQPKGYVPITVEQRAQWNNFLDYLEKQKLGGSTDLDKRDQSLGLKAMAAYKKLNPTFSITPAMLPSIQWEQYELRKGDSFSTLTPEELKYARSGLSPAFLAKPMSPVDGWIGSLTSRQYYPTAHRGTNTGESYDFGTDIESYVKSLNNPSLAEKYKVVQK